MSRSWIITVIILVLVGAGIYLAWRSIVEMGYESCVLSIEDSFGNRLSLPDLREKIPVSDEWRYLSEAEERLLFDSIADQGRGFDCAQFRDYANGEALRGDNGRVKVGKVEKHIRARLDINDGRERITPDPHR